MTDTNRVTLYLLEESTWGTTPSNGAWKTLRSTGESLNFNITNTQSDEIRADRNVQDIIRTDANTSGDLNFELAYGGEISSGVNHAFDDLLEGLLCSDWSSDILKNGTTKKSYSVEKHFADATNGNFQTFKGNRVDGMSLNVSAGSIVTGSFSLQGKTMAIAEASASSGTPSAATTTEIINAVNNVGTLTEGGSSLTDSVMSISLNVTNNLRTNNEIGTLGAAAIGLGQFVVTGSMSAYFANKTLYNKFVQGTDSALSFRTSDAAGNYYDWSLPKIEYTSGSILAGSANADVMAELGFQAKYDASNTCSLKITRNSA